MCDAHGHASEMPSGLGFFVGEEFVAEADHGGEHEESAEDGNGHGDHAPTHHAAQQENEEPQYEEDDNPDCFHNIIDLIITHL